jgi:hypothetical protein
MLDFGSYLSFVSCTLGFGRSFGSTISDSKFLSIFT